MPGEIRSIADFGETTMDAEEDCWLVLSDVTKQILARTMPLVRGPGRGDVLAFPGRAPKRQNGGGGAP